MVRMPEFGGRAIGQRGSGVSYSQYIESLTARGKHFVSEWSLRQLMPTVLVTLYYATVSVALRPYIHHASSGSESAVVKIFTPLILKREADNS